MGAQSVATQSIRSGVKPRLKGWRSKINHHLLRRVMQWFFLSFIVFLIVQHIVTGEESAMVTASPEAFCPFGGLETAYQYLTGGGNFVPHTHLSNLVVLGAVALTAVLFRSSFCGWICPLGFLQDLLSGLSILLQKRLPALRRTLGSIKGRASRLAVLDRYLRFLKYLILAWAIAGSAAYSFMVFRDYDPWAAFLNLAEFSFTPGVVVLLATLIASFFVERPWCRYACPLGAVNGLLGKLSPVYLKREESACKVCQVCTKACPMGLPVHSMTTIQSADCMTCLECVGACPRNGALELKIGFPLVSK